MAAFAAKLGLIRRRIQRDLKAGDTTQTSVSAAVVRLLHEAHLHGAAGLRAPARELRPPTGP